jgi:holo-[acyl-carrier protein] synthase
MIVGVGVDLIEVPRMQRALENPKTGPRFRDRVYTENEIEYCEGRGRKYESYAARFAAKEAVMKAFGVGWGSKVAWMDVEVVSMLSGKPELQLHNNASDYARELGVKRLFLSLSHTKGYAIAVVTAEG